MHAMRSILKLVAVLGALAACLLPQRAAAAPAAALRVVATTSDVAAVLQRVGAGRTAEVTTLAKGIMDPHYLEAKPSYIVSLRSADLLAYNGLQLEIGWLPLLLEGARNRKIVWGAPGNLPMHEGVEVLEVPQGTLSREQGDIHPEGNPHYTLDPRNMMRMAATAAAALSRLDPEGRTTYEHNRDAFVEELQRGIPAWEETLRPYKGREVVCYHKQFEYLLRWLGLVPVGYIENKPGLPPSPRHLEELEKTMRERRVAVLLVSTFVKSDNLVGLASRTGARLVVVPAAVRAVDGVDTPQAFFDHLVGRIAAAFAEVSGP